MTNIIVSSGDIGKFRADALITAINSGGLWFGGIDGVIQREAGNHFHNQALAKMPLKDGQTVVACGNEKIKSAFANVIFVVDDLLQPLKKIVRLGLLAANARGYNVVTVPTIRMGVMLGVVEKTEDEALEAIATSVIDYSWEKSTLKDIIVVVYNNTRVENKLHKLIYK